jgi:hypothetical protein
VDFDAAEIVATASYLPVPEHPLTGKLSGTFLRGGV